MSFGLSVFDRMGKKAVTLAVAITIVLSSFAASLFVAPLTARAANCVSGSLIKGSLSAVYYCGADGKRYVFTNEKVYFTWYSDFSGVVRISDAELASVMIGGNVTYRPGVKMIKIQSDPRIYAIAHNGTLRWITSESVASCLYGSNWNTTSVDDVSDAFFVNYNSNGAAINSCSDYSRAVEMSSSTTINQDKNLPLSGDVTAPIVSSTNPASAATGVSLNKQVQVTFSEPMSVSTLNNSTFSVQVSGGSNLSGSVSYSGQTATFSPVSNLAANTTYIATVTTGARDASGNALSSNYTWSFTTGNSLDTSAPTVASKDPSNGQTNVPLNKQVSATFSEQMDPSTINSGTFTLRRGVVSVGGVVSYSNLTARFTPNFNLDVNTTYTATVTAGAKDLAGNSLANDHVWSFTTGNSLDTTAPTVASTDPNNGATAVPMSQVVRATFSETMEASSINNSTFTLKQGSATIPGDVTYSGNTASFTPGSTLSPSTTYTATVTNGARDVAGNNLANDYVWSFTTGPLPDTTAPTVTSTSPTNGSSSVGTNQQILVTFSEPMNASSLNNLTFVVMQGGNQVVGAISYSGVTAKFTPTLSLMASTAYTVTVTSGAMDTAGNHLASDYSWSFTTGTSTDSTAPTVASTDPANGAVNVLRGKVVRATFSEQMDPATINGSTVIMRQGVNSVSGTLSYSNAIVDFTPSSTLQANVTYTMTISSGARDSAGNALENDYIWSFTTGNN